MAVKTNTAFLNGLQGMLIDDVTMLSGIPNSRLSSLPAAWLDLPRSDALQEPLTVQNSAIRSKQRRALLFVAIADARPENRETWRSTILTVADAVEAALDALQIGFVITYNLFADVEVTALTVNYYGVVARITGE